ncbi:ArsR/SmtB family transcription factor [Deferribacter abyssi]|uniref:ArsR/SmtB family transcription factor n=1 Tax=Deferribacter abyssi TaxID=213806 RepID=UPI003C280E3B
MCVCDLENVLELKQSTLSTHLSKLKQANILVDMKDGKWTYYRINEHLEKSKKIILNEVLNNFLKSETALTDLKKLSSNKNSCIPAKKILVVDYDNSLYSQIIEIELSKKDNITCVSAGIAPAPEVNPLIKKLYPKEYAELRFFTKNVSNFKKYYFDLVLILKDFDNIENLNIKFGQIETINLNDIKNLKPKDMRKKLIEKCEVYL